MEKNISEVERQMTNWMAIFAALLRRQISPNICAPTNQKRKDHQCNINRSKEYEQAQPRRGSTDGFQAHESGSASLTIEKI